MMNKKGQLGKKVNSIAIVIVTIIVLFSLYSALVPEVQTAGDSMNDSSRCTAVGCFYNATDNTQTSANCRENSSNTSNICPDAVGDGLPLSSIFSGGGIIILLIMVGLLLAILKLAMGKSKK